MATCRLGYLLLATPDPKLPGGADHALLLFLYNSGTRAEKAAQLLVSELAFHPAA